MNQSAVSAPVDRGDEPRETVPCPLCGDARVEVALYSKDRLFARPGTYRIVRCLSCQLLYTSPRPTPAALAAHYPSEYFIYRTPEEANRILRPVVRAIARRRWQAYLERLEAVRGRFRADTKIVDVGCGLNELLATLRQLRGCHGIGVDLQPEVVAYVRDKLAMQIHHGTLFDARFASGEFDVVTMNEYLEHEPNPRDVLAEARRVTVKGGHLALEIPLMDSLPAKIFGARWCQIDAPRHLVYFTRATLAEMLRRTGYRLVHTRTFQIPFLIGVSVLQALGHRRLGRMNLFDSVLIALAALPFLPLAPVLDEFMFAVAVAE